jgi:hypothetical protein
LKWSVEREKWPQQVMVLTGVFMPLRNKVMADMVGNLIEFKILLLFGLYRDYYY